MEVKEHCVIVVADGARFSVKDYIPSKDRAVDDIGLLLKREIIKRSEELGIEVNLKLMDLTYVVRAVPANEYDCNLCAKLAESAVHCAFAGFTNFSVGLINNKPCMIPSELLCGKNKRKISYNSDDYLMLLASTGQPSFYPETVEKKKDDIDDKEKKEEKKEIEKDKNNIIINDIKKNIDENKENKDDEKKKIFDFH